MIFATVLFHAINLLIVGSISNISCPIEHICIIDCEKVSCQHSTINATLSTSLTVTCGNCAFAVIICPSSSNSNSNINTNCIINIEERGRELNAYLSIFGGSNNNKMEVNVNHESSFHHSYLSCGDNSSCFLNCFGGLETCLNIEVNTTYNTSMNIVCKGINSCHDFGGHGLNSIQSIADDKLLNIQCLGYSRCDWHIFNISGDILINSTADSYYNAYNLPVSFHIDAVNSNSAKIYIENTIFMSNNGIYLNNTKLIQLSVSNKAAGNNVYGYHSFGGNGYFEGNIYGENAKQFNLFCGGHKESCSKGKYYISSVNSQINCDNYGCWNLSIYSQNGLNKNVIIIEDNNCLCDVNSSFYDNSCISNWNIFCGTNYKNHSVFSNGSKCSPSICCGHVLNQTKFDCIATGGSSDISQTGRVLIVISGFVCLCLISSGCYWIGNRKSIKVEDQQQQAFIN